MTFIILGDRAKNITDSIFYSIMANEVTDCSNKDQFTICFRWTEKFLIPMGTLSGFAMLKICKYISLEYPGIRVLCLTRWTVRAGSMESIFDNWVALQQVWDESLGNFEPGI